MSNDFRVGVLGAIKKGFNNVGRTSLFSQGHPVHTAVYRETISENTERNELILILLQGMRAELYA